MLFRVIAGFVISALGFMIVWKSEWMHQNFGTIAWAEENMATSGGSRTMYKIIGMVAIFIGFVMITNLHQQLLHATLGKLFGVPDPQDQLSE